MTRTIFHTAATLDGFLADDQDSLDWLFVVDGGEESLAVIDVFLAGVGVIVMGSTTYEWVWEHEVRDKPETWTDMYGDRAVYVFTTRELPRIPGAANVRFVHGDVAAHWADIARDAGGREVWVVGGGDLVGQFFDAGHLDEIRVSLAPATLGSGRPLLPRRIGSDRLVLQAVRQVGQFAELVYAVRPEPVAADRISPVAAT